MAEGKGGFNIPPEMLGDLFNGHRQIEFDDRKFVWNKSNTKKLRDAIEAAIKDGAYVREGKTKFIRVDMALVYTKLKSEDFITAEATKIVSKQNSAKAYKGHEIDRQNYQYAIELWEKNLGMTYVAFAKKFHIEIGAEIDTVKRWIGKYEKDKKTKIDSQ